MIVVDKPAGMVVHPAPGNPDSTLVNALIAHCGDSLSGVGGVLRPGIVHRLDKNTSGLIVAAKTDAAHRSLSSQFAARTLSRVYQAVVWGLARPGGGQDRGQHRAQPREPQEDGGAAPRRAGGGHPLSRAIGAPRPREPGRVPPRDRTHPPDSRALRAYLPPLDRRSRVWARAPAARGDARRPGGVGDLGIPPPGAPRPGTELPPSGQWRGHAFRKRAARRHERP